MAFSLEGHVAIVTGNSSGLGKEIGMALGQAGAKVPVNFCYNEERAQSTLKEYQAAELTLVSYRPMRLPKTASTNCFRRLKLSLETLISLFLMQPVTNHTSRSTNMTGHSIRT